MICTRCGYTNKVGCLFCIKCGQRMNTMTSGSTSSCFTLSPGLVLQGRYNMVKQLGKGGMGVVYLAKDNRFSNRICVVKEMIEFLLNEEERQKAIARFNQEADLLASINHPNVPQVYDRFSENNRHYLVMEFVPGMDLKDLLQNHMSRYGKALAEEDVAVYFMQLCLVLKYIHNHQPPILHRDIKPSNIIITPEGRAKLVDFGIAKAIKSHTQGTSIGTQGYAAPEQYKGLADTRTDIYALGATIHHLLTGRDPQAETPFDYPPANQLNSSLSEGISDIIGWMLEMNMDLRPQNADEIIERIKKLYPGIEQSILSHKLNDSISSIITKKLDGAIDDPVTGDRIICSTCGRGNKPSSRFCVKCGKPLSGTGIALNPSNPTVTVDRGNSSRKMIVPEGHKKMNTSGRDFIESIKVPGKDGSITLNLILERLFLEGTEYIYITEKQSSIAGQEVFVYNVIRNTQGIMQYIKPVTEPFLKEKLHDHWIQFLKE